MTTIEFDGGPLDGQTQTVDSLPEAVAAMGPMVDAFHGLAYGYVPTEERRDGRVVYRYTGQHTGSIFTHGDNVDGR